MSLFNNFFGNKLRAETPTRPNQAVLIHLNGASLPNSVYDNTDLMTLEDRLSATLEGTGVGEVDGNDVGPEGATVYLYGTDAEKLFATIESVVREYPLCEHATVTIRQGKPGTAQREIVL